ncbi:hypothetical protein PHMEG_00014668 [Phytophthora megakarya]|uniref:Uncharacterized protein n=1 Tax=Phytophthora megakarya TaxID=4795 RepID=A0A225W374_9STRA|nr:hypothetical protein PHMEG_00014668 [Phytophthora megakarya]
MRCSRPSPLDVSSVSRFHDALYFGHVDVVRRMIYRDPSLANARSSARPHATSLMICATSHKSTVKTTIILVKLLLAKGASLRTKDDHRNTVLMAVCASGGHPNIVKCLLDWDQKSKHKILLWSDQDDQGRTALGLASLNGHGRLASSILDLLETDEMELKVLYALDMALKSGDETGVVELLRNKKLQKLVREDRKEGKLTIHGEWNQLQQVEELTVATCVAKAVENDMLKVVREMHRLNRSVVGHATWFALCDKMEICGKGKAKIVHRKKHVQPEFEEIAALHRRDCVWDKMKCVFWIRYASVPKKYGKMEINIVADLPDAVFRIVAEFLKPNFNDAEEAQKERFKAVLDLSSW